ncbi:MAG: hypothetical protein CFE36_03590, partial [Sphingomonadaceae bacterium PASS1]
MVWISAGGLVEGCSTELPVINRLKPAGSKMPPFSLQTIDHVVIRAVNAAELVAFYVNAIGCKLAWDRPDLGLTHLEAGDAMVAIISIAG